MQNSVAGPIRSSAGSLRLTLPEMGCHPPKCSLVDFPLRCSRERDSIVFEFNYRRGSLFTHEADRFLVTKPVRPLHRVVHMPPPVILSHVGKGRTHAALRSYGMGAGRKDFGHAGCSLTRFCKAQASAQAGTSGPYHDHVMLVMDNFVSGSHWCITPKRLRELPTGLRP